MTIGSEMFFIKSKNFEKLHGKFSNSGEYKPTKKGLAVSEKNIDGVIKLLNNSKQELLNERK